MAGAAEGRNRPPTDGPPAGTLGGMTAETFAVVRLPRPRMARLVSCHADQAAAQTAYQFAKPPAVLVRLAGDGFAVLAGKAVEADLGADPKFWAAVVAAVRARRPWPGGRRTPGSIRRVNAQAAAAVTDPATGTAPLDVPRLAKGRRPATGGQVTGSAG